MYKSIILTLGMLLIVLTAFACAAPKAPVEQPNAPIANPPAQPPQQNAPAANPPAQVPPQNNVPNEPQPAPVDAAFKLVGIWDAEIPTEYGTMYAEMILEPNNHYSYQVRWNDLMSYEVGSYQVGSGFIHFAVEDYQPKTYKGQELSHPLSWTVWYTVLDANTMRWNDRIMNTSWQVTRRQG